MKKTLFAALALCLCALLAWGASAEEGAYVLMNIPYADFYAAEVAPLLEKLDQAGQELLAPCPDKDVERLFAEFTPLWAEIEYEIAARRTRYLNDRLFED